MIMGCSTQLPRKPPENHQPLSPSSPDTNFRRKLSYQQSLVIMDDWATPKVDALSALKRDQQLLNQIPFTVKTFVQERATWECLMFSVLS